MESEDQIVSAIGNKLNIINIDIKLFDEPIKVYNFEVEDYHNYFVSGLDVLVHNTCNANQKYIQNAKGKGNNLTVNSQEEALNLIKKAKPDLKQFPTYTNEKYKAGYEIHPPEPNVGNVLPHIKWKDWSLGKAKGADGHIFFQNN